MERSPIALFAAVSLAAGAAAAGNQDLYGFGARGPGMGGAAVAFPRGFEAIWYNPAGLVIGGERAFSIGFQATTFDLRVHSPRPDDPTLQDAADQDAITGVTLGVAVRLPMLGALRDRIALGLGLYIPSNTLLSAQIPRPYTPQFSLVADRARTLSISAAVAVRILDELQIGGGVRALAGLGGFIEVAPNELGRIGSDVEDELVARYAPMIGAVGRPHPDWSIGLAFRGELGGSYSLPIRADLGDDLPLKVPELTIAGMAVYDPAQVALHLGYRPGPWLSVEAGVTWRLWSDFPLPIENTTASLPAQPALDFGDTFAPRVGAESRWDLGAWRLVGRLGYAFEPTPVPDQTGRNSFLDSDRHVASLGFGLGWGDDTDGRGFRVDLDAYGQVHVLTERYATKDLRTGDAVVVSDDAGFPWIGHEGTIVSFGATVSVQL